MKEDKFKRLKEKQKEISDLKKQMITESNSIFTDLTKEFFDENPELKSFGWNQYTPYFNDGDTCEFSANTDYIYINGEHVDDCDWINEKTVTNWGKWNNTTKVYEGRVEIDNDKWNKSLSDITTEIKDFLGHFEDDFFISQFGDHSEITVTREGIDISDYEHD